LPSRRAEARIELGARIAEAKYRQLKLAAVLRGVTVQTLVEHAIQEFLTNHPELLHSSASEQLSKSISGRFGFGTAPISSSAWARRRVKDSAVSGSSGHSASASRNSGSTSSIVLMDGSRVRLRPSKTISQ
jgi:hypothetical protein